LIGGCAGHEETVTVSSGQTPDDTSTGDGGVNDRDDVLELGLKDRVEVGR
jgi:hypothetical protein